MTEKLANQANDANNGVVKGNARLPGIVCTTRGRALLKVKRPTTVLQGFKQVQLTCVGPNEENCYISLSIRQIESR